MKYAIGIDPGTRTGFAVWDLDKKQWERIVTLDDLTTEAAVLDYAKNADCFVVVEDARQRKWFGNTGRERLQGAGHAKAAAGRWERFLKHHKIPFAMQKPGKTWKGATLAATWTKVTGWKGKTSDHARDAAWLVFEMSKTKIELLCGATL